jgi:hypothetical protein
MGEERKVNKVLVEKPERKRETTRKNEVQMGRQDQNGS